MAPMDRPKRMLVRTSLVAGSTVATLIGAQTLIMIDNQNPALDMSADASAEQIQITSAPELSIPTLVPTQVTVRVLPTAQIAHVAPSISIVRQSGQTTNQQAPIVAAQPTAVPTQVVIQPPATVQATTAIPTAVPMVVQQQRPPRTHSSR